MPRITTITQLADKIAADWVGSQNSKALSAHIQSELEQHLPGITGSGGVTLQEAFKKIVNRKPKELPFKINGSTLRFHRKKANDGIYPGLAVMREMITKAGYTKIQDEKWRKG
jgi:hypothetical protein